MNKRDDWDHDPSVRAMRTLFARMDLAQGDLLRRLGISPYDGRLRACREDARYLFERVTSQPHKGSLQDEGDAAGLYIRCLIRALKQHGLPIPAGAVRDDDLLDGFRRR